MGLSAKDRTQSPYTFFHCNRRLLDCRRGDSSKLHLWSYVLYPLTAPTFLSLYNFSFKRTAIIAQAMKTLHIFCEAVIYVKVIQLVLIAKSGECVSSESVLTSKHNIRERLLLQCIFLIRNFMSFPSNLVMTEITQSSPIVHYMWRFCRRVGWSFQHTLVTL